MPRKRKTKSTFDVLTRKHKRVTCYCPDCHGQKKVDIRTKRNHESRYLLGLEPTTQQGPSTLSNPLISRQSDSEEYEGSTATSGDDLQNEDLTMAFEDDLPSAHPSVKGKFKEPPSLITQTFDWEDDIYPSDQDEAYPEEESSDDEANLEEESLGDQDEIPSFDFNAPQIDPETFDPPFQSTEGRQNEWIILWLMKFQQRFNLPDIGLDALIKFLRRVFQYYKIYDADIFPTSIYTAKSGLNFSTKYREYAICTACYSLYNPAELKNYKEDDQPSVKIC